MVSREIRLIPRNPLGTQNERGELIQGVFKQSHRLFERFLRANLATGGFQLNREVNSLGF